MADCLVCLFQSLLEGTVEASQQVVLLHPALGNAVQLVLQVCRELHINDILEILLQHIHHHKAKLRGLEMLVNALHVAPGLNGLNNGGIGAGAPDFLFLQGLDQGGIVVAGRRLCEVLLGQGLHQIQSIPFRQLRQDDILFLLGGICPGIDCREAGEFQAGACSPEAVAAACLNGNAHGIVHCRHHLAGNEPLPDQGVELQLVLAQILFHRLRSQLRLSGTDGLMCILGLLARHIDIGLFWQIILAEVRLNVAAGLILCHLGKAGGVGTHVGDKTHGPLVAQFQTFIELLGQHHGLA